MKLQSLHIVGFKTFADRTIVEPGSGITAIVGPNGSGKSNIADALLWVLGEQNPRLLRACDAKDIIFAGCKTRKPLGMAEVRIVLDNSDMALPIQAAEVTVTRRIFRSGEAQYLINNSPCRLKDVTDLFLDTGAGRGAYSIVGQGEIDAVLSARPEERRELFEEAAGIKKYRTRKREALRRLEAAEANLVRIGDILVELEQQREPLAQQADAARRYNALTERLHTIELEVLLAEAGRAQAELATLRNRRERTGEAVADLDARLAILERESESAGHELAQAEHEQDAAALSRQSALTTLERLESRLHLTQERAGNAQAAAERMDRELAELKQRQATIQNELQSTLAELDAGAALSARYEQEYEAAQAEVRRLDELAFQAQSYLEEVRTQQARSARQQAEARAAAEAARARLEEMDRRIGELEDLLRAFGAEHRRADEAAAALAAREQELAAEHAALRLRREELAGAYAARQSALAEANKQLEATQRRLTEVSTRLSVLQETHAAGEGLYQGVRAVLKAQREGQVRGNFRPIVDVLSVPAEYRTAIEIALGPAMQDLVCSSGDEARQAIEWLKRTRSGRATFLPLDLLSPQQPLRQDHLQSFSGVVGIASSLVAFDAQFKPAVDLLLGRTIVARDLSSAIEAARSIRGWNRLVTLEGELITPGGAITGGSAADRGVHLVARKGEMDDLAHAIRNLEQEANSLAHASAQAHEHFLKAEADLKACEEALARCNVRRAELATELQGAQRERESLAARVLDVQREADRLRNTRRALSDELHSLAGRAASPDAGSDEKAAPLEAAQEQHRALLSAAEDARRRLGRIEVERARTAEQYRALQANGERLRLALKDVENRIGVIERERQTAVQNLEQARIAAAAITSERSEAQTLLAQYQNQWTFWRDRRQALLAENYQRSASMKEARTRRTEIAEEMHATDLQIARVEARLAQILERLAEEYSISKEEALNRRVDAAPGQTAREIAALRREIKAMGQVNTGALEEYDRLSQRLTFLTEQRDDLEKARKSLTATISEIDANSRTLFLDTFQAVSQQFEALFRRLFRGGTARVTLTDAGDPLEAGIEIVAQPPGKALQPLSLLSGGERALTALALLFSFLAVRPSPFCILDEVDAALDGTNVEHFAQLLRDFSASIQFLVITHNPTTIACADRWYGVTMEEPGVSRVLHYRVPPFEASPPAEEPARSAANLLS
ncbi:MAG: chromosome segregation protein SMC [Chthonomonadales bacterium]